VIVTTLGRYFYEYELIETYEANNLQFVTRVGQIKALCFLSAFEESADCALLSFFCDDQNLRMSLFK